VLDRIRAATPDLVLVALGAPKQELWIAEAAPDLRPAVLLGIGAAVDFVAGVARRAPGWMSASGLEWFFRLAQEPRRMWRRYLVRDPEFLVIVLRDLLRSRGVR
jgi:N-acetylglucosaminyldiphosphoundecaprenol N-acetyl-beta-D-mannosaminyltransferase